LLHPAQDREVKAQMPIDETATAASVLPLPKIGKNAPSVDLISTQ
jgi:hypothetical protein